MQSCGLPFTVFGKRGGTSADPNRKYVGTGIALSWERCGFSPETTGCQTVSKFVISGIGFTPEAAGAFSPSWNSPAASGHDLPDLLFLLLFPPKKGLGQVGQVLGFAWWPLPELNRGHEDFQSFLMNSKGAYQAISY